MYEHLSKSQFFRIAHKVHGKKYSYAEMDYTDANTKVTISCPEHGPFQQTPKAHLNGYKCPKCGLWFHSRTQDKVAKFIRELGFEVQDNFRFDAPRSQKQLDIYVPSAQLAIEINGIPWHVESRGKGKDYHVYKTDTCEKQGIKLLQFWNSDIHNRTGIVKSIIRGALSKPNYILDSDGLSIEIIKPKLANRFLRENHLSGEVDARVYYGLVGDAGLMAVIALSPTADGSWTLSRHCSRRNYLIHNYPQALLEPFEKKYDPKSITYLANRRWDDASPLSECGFKRKKIMPPNFSYVSRTVLLPSDSATREKVMDLLGKKFDPEKTERENLLDNGYDILWDCGNLVFRKLYT